MIGLALLAFVLAATDEAMATRRTLAIAERRRVPAMLWSGAYVVIVGAWAYVTVNNLWTLLPSVLGSALGSWWGTRKG